MVFVGRRRARSTDLDGTEEELMADLASNKELNVELDIYLGPMHDLVGFRCSEAPASSETISSGSEVNLIIYPFNGHREGVDQGHCIIGCVSVGHGNI